MLGRSLVGRLGIVATAALVVGAAWALVTNFALESPGEFLSPTLGSAAVIGLVVLGLAGLGVGAARRLGTPYW